MKAPRFSSQPAEILLVEDNRLDIRMAQEALRDSKVSHRLSVVTDGEQALNFLHQIDLYTTAPRPDLILLDLNLPRKDGRAVLAEIKQDPNLRLIPVVILTTSSAEEDVLKTYALHANCFVTKPVEMQNFFDVVRQICDFWLTVAAPPPSFHT